jgi:hypothetical protein
MTEDTMVDVEPTNGLLGLLHWPDSPSSCFICLSSVHNTSMTEDSTMVDVKLIKTRTNTTASNLSTGHVVSLRLRRIVTCCVLVVFSALLSDVVSYVCLVMGPQDRHSTAKKLVVNQIALPSEPDNLVEELLKKRMRIRVHANKTKGKIISPLENCSATSQVRILQYSDTSWALVSLDANGQSKTMGGDEYYVTYTDASSKNATLVAFDHDNRDGTYDLNFSTTPMNPVNITGLGILTVHLQYTCGIGAMGQPLKNQWKSGATCGASWSRANVTTPLYQVFSPPTDTGIDFSPHSMVIGYGDSLMEGLFRDKSKEKFLYRPNVTFYHDNPEYELVNKSVNGLLRKLRGWHGHQLNQSNVALVIGSAVWDLLSRRTVDPDFLSHLEAARQYVKRLQQEYPNVALYWRSPSAFHPHQLGEACPETKACRSRTRYMSNSRAQVLYEKQKSLMAEMGIPFLDLWEAYYLSGDRMRHVGDGRHYSNKLNMLMQSWFYRD